MTNTQVETVAKAVDGGTAPITPEMLAAGVLAYELIGISGGIVNTAEDHVALIYEAMREFSPSQHTGWSEEAVEAAAKALWERCDDDYKWHGAIREPELASSVEWTRDDARAALTAALDQSPTNGAE